MNDDNSPKPFEWSTLTDWTERFGVTAAHEMLGINHSNAHDHHSQHDCSSPDVSWGTGFNHFWSDFNAW